jgi:2-polyprenyl-3-methyl-5-hydroxy-6-metoxy-1,4-benzoquinol methylase
MAELNKLKIWACYYYHQMGFNITHIVPTILEYSSHPFSLEQTPHLFKKNPYKSSANKRDNFDVIRQNYSDVESFDWVNAKGIGTVTGLNSLRALDFDNCTDIEFIKLALSILELPLDYEWVVNTGSKNGFHIIFYSDALYEFPCYKTRIRFFKSNNEYSSKFKKLDLIWKNHLILPPSLHHSGNKYEFVFTDCPLEKPRFVSWYKIEELLRLISYENGKPLTNFNGDTEDGYGVVIDKDELHYFEQNNILNSRFELQIPYNNLVDYYHVIASSLDNVYKKEHYKVSIEALKDILKRNFSNKSIIEVACGNGFWTNMLSEFCKTILATDINDNCIQEASKRIKQPNVVFELNDCNSLQLDKKYDGLFGGFIISHISKSQLKEFFNSINKSVKKGGSVVLFDNRLVANNNMEIHSTNDDGDTFQRRVTPSGREYLILKNFFEYDELRNLISEVAYDIEYTKLKYFWALKYKVK